MRKNIHILISTNVDNVYSKIYDFLMMAAIIVSLIPLAFKETNTLFQWMDYITVGIFIIDYILRLSVADFKLKKGVASFFIYPVTPMAIIDITLINTRFRLLRIIRLARTLKVLRALKILRYSKSFDIVSRVLKKQKRVLVAVGAMAVAYIMVSALIIYNVEPESFKTFFDAVYWATISLTTVGYGDIYPVTMLGRVVTMFSSIFGIAIIALPSGVITAGYLDEISKNKEDK